VRDFRGPGIFVALGMLSAEDEAVVAECETELTVSASRRGPVGEDLLERR
jgi:hypothetical protein